MANQVNWNEVEQTFVAGIEGQVKGKALVQDAIKLYINAKEEGQELFLKAAFASVQKAREEGGDAAAQLRENCIRKNLGEATDKTCTIKKVYGGNGKRGNPHIGYSLELRAKREEEPTEFEKAFKAASKLSEMLAGLSTDEKAQILAALNKAAASEEAGE